VNFVVRVQFFVDVANSLFLTFALITALCARIAGRAAVAPVIVFRFFSALLFLFSFFPLRRVEDLILERRHLGEVIDAGKISNAV